jgi:MFS family permease
MTAMVARVRGALAAPGTANKGFTGRARAAARSNLAGALSMVWMTCGGPGSVLLTLFLQEALHAAKWQIGLVMTMVYLGPTFEPLGAYLVERLRRRRALFVSAFLGNRIPFLALALIPFLGSADARPGLGLAVVWAVIAATRVAGHIGTPAWWSWMGDLVPERRRGRFFGCRTQWASAVTAASLVVGMALLQLLGGMDNGLLVSVLFGVGTLFGIADILLYLRMPEPPLRSGREPGAAAPTFTLAQAITACAGPFRQPGFRRLLLGMGLWSFSANLVLPFLPVYQRGEVLRGTPVGLGVSWLFLAVLCVSSSVAAALSSQPWAGWGERRGPRRLLILGSGYLFVNLLYLVVLPGHGLWLLVVVALIGGALTAAWTVSSNQLLLGMAPRENRSFYVAGYDFTNGWLMAGGPLLGGWLADHMPAPTWLLPGGLSVCYFHVLLLLACTGGAVALVILARVPEPVRTVETVVPRLRSWRLRRPRATAPVELIQQEGHECRPQLVPRRELWPILSSSAAARTDR